MSDLTPAREWQIGYDVKLHNLRAELLRAQQLLGDVRQNVLTMTLEAQLEAADYLVQKMAALEVVIAEHIAKGVEG